MHFWKTVTCLAHLVANTHWEFFERDDFALTAQEVDEQWQASLRPSTPRLQGKSWRELRFISHYEAIARAAEYEALVYCPEHHYAEKQFHGRLAGATFLSKGQDQLGTHHWLIAKHDAQRTLIVALRGTTSNRREIFQDLDARAMILPCATFPQSCQATAVHVHRGFYTHMELYREQVTNLVQAYHREYPDYDIILTAHSLGAATGALLAKHWIETGRVAFTAAYLFGLPIVGNEAFAQRFNDSRVLQVFNRNDIVPTLGFMHGTHIKTPGIWIDMNNSMRMGTHGHSDILCEDLSWQWHSYFRTIPINDNYCKLTLTVPDPTPVEHKPLIPSHWVPGVIACTVFAAALSFALYRWIKGMCKQTKENHV